MPPWFFEASPPRIGKHALPWVKKRKPRGARSPHRARPPPARLWCVRLSIPHGTSRAMPLRCPRARALVLSFSHTLSLYMTSLPAVSALASTPAPLMSEVLLATLPRPEVPGVSIPFPVAEGSPLHWALERFVTPIDPARLPEYDFAFWRQRRGAIKLLHDATTGADAWPDFTSPDGIIALQLWLRYWYAGLPLLVAQQHWAKTHRRLAATRERSRGAQWVSIEMHRSNRIMLRALVQFRTALRIEVRRQRQPQRCLEA